MRGAAPCSTAAACVRIRELAGSARRRETPPGTGRGQDCDFLDQSGGWGTPCGRDYDFLDRFRRPAPGGLEGTINLPAVFLPQLSGTSSKPVKKVAIPSGGSVLPNQSVEKVVVLSTGSQRPQCRRCRQRQPPRQSPPMVLHDETCVKEISAGLVSVRDAFLAAASMWPWVVSKPLVNRLIVQIAALSLGRLQIAAAPFVRRPFPPANCATLGSHSKTSGRRPPCPRTYPPYPTRPPRPL